MNRAIKRTLGYFLRGLLFVTPILITGYAVYAIIRFLDMLIPGLPPGVSIVVVLVGITLIGVVSFSILFQSVMSAFESVVLKTPGLKIIYSSIKDLLGALVGNKKTFKQPVLVLMMKEANVHRLGFITRNDLSEVGIHGLVAVYFPHSYTFSGNLFLVPRENITVLHDFPSSDALKFIISGGVTDPISREEEVKK